MNIQHKNIKTLTLCLFILGTLLCESVYAIDLRGGIQQRGLNFDTNTGRPSESKPVLPDYQEEQPVDFTLPPVKKNFLSTGGEKVYLKDVRFKGNTVFSQNQLLEICQPFIGQPVSLGDLEELRFRLTKYYTDSGYITSGVLLEDQHMENGIVEYTIIEGRLSDIKVTGNERLNENYIKGRLTKNLNGVLNSHQLQEGFQQLLYDPLIDRLNGKVRPGEKPGEAVLDLEVTRARPYNMQIVFDNHHAPSVGEFEVTVNGTVRNLSGFGDALTLSLDKSEGGDGVAGLYSIPINPHNTRISVNFEDSDSSVVEDSLKNADIESDYRTIGIGIEHPFIKKPNRELTMGLNFSWRKSRTYLLGIGTPFSAGVESDGKSSTSVIRFSQDYIERWEKQVFAARSTFNLGVSAFNSTKNSGGLPDSRFFSWLGQIQYAHRIGEEGAQLLVKGNVQLANENLLPLEQIAIGGPESVRGYRTNQFIRDNGFDTSIEYRHPISGDPLNRTKNSIQLAAFVDAGSAWNKGDSRTDNMISSAGLGLLWRYRKFNAELYWAHAFKNVSTSSQHYIQDDGISFRLSADF